MTPEDDKLDRDLMARAKAGEIRAFRDLMDRHQTCLTGQVKGMGNSHADAEEIVQETFRRAYKAMASFRGDCKVGAWFYRIARNLSYNHYWYWHRRRRGDHVSIDAPLADLLPDGQVSVGRIAELSELASAITTSMEQLEWSHREVLVMRGVENLSYEEISEQLGVNVGTVKSRIARAREKLRAILEKSFPGLALATFGPERTTA